MSATLRILYACLFLGFIFVPTQSIAKTCGAQCRSIKDKKKRKACKAQCKAGKKDARKQKRETRKENRQKGKENTEGYKAGYQADEDPNCVARCKKVKKSERSNCRKGCRKQKRDERKQDKATAKAEAEGLIVATPEEEAEEDLAEDQAEAEEEAAEEAAEAEEERLEQEEAARAEAEELKANKDGNDAAGSGVTAGSGAEGVGQSGQFNLDAMLAKERKKAEAIHNKLKKLKPKQKGIMQKARKAYINQRRSARKTYRAGIKKLRGEKKNARKGAREARRQAKKKARGIKDRKKRRAARKAARDNYRNKRKKARQAYRNKRRNLRKQYRIARSKARKTWRSAKRKYRAFRKQLMKAAFQAKVMPKIVQLLKPMIMKALADMDTGGGKNASAGASAIAGFNRGRIKDRDVLKFFIKYKIWEGIDPVIRRNFDKATKKLWSIVDKPMNAAEQAMVASVGSVPAAGGVLASVVSFSFGQVYSAAKGGVNQALHKLRVHIQNGIIDAILNAFMKGESAGPMLSKAGAKAAKDGKKAMDKKNGVAKAAKQKGLDALKKSINQVAQALGKEEQSELNSLAQAELEAAK